MKICVKIPNDPSFFPSSYCGQDVEVEVLNFVFPDGLRWGVEGTGYNGLRLSDSAAAGAYTSLVAAIGAKPQTITIGF